MNVVKKMKKIYVTDVKGQLGAACSIQTICAPNRVYQSYLFLYLHRKIINMAFPVGPTTHRIVGPGQLVSGNFTAPINEFRIPNAGAQIYGNLRSGITADDLGKIVDEAFKLHSVPPDYHFTVINQLLQYALPDFKKNQPDFLPPVFASFVQVLARREENRFSPEQFTASLAPAFVEGLNKTHQLTPGGIRPILFSSIQSIRSGHQVKQHTDFLKSFYVAVQEKDPQLGQAIVEILGQYKLRDIVQSSASPAKPK